MILLKVATKNRQNRQLAEFRQSALTKLVEGQILCEKLVSQASFELPSPKNQKGKDWPIIQFEFSRQNTHPARSTLKSMSIFSYMYVIFCQPFLVSWWAEELIDTHHAMFFLNCPLGPLGWVGLARDNWLGTKLLISYFLTHFWIPEEHMSW